MKPWVERKVYWGQTAKTVGEGQGKQNGRKARFYTTSIGWGFGLMGNVPPDRELDALVQGSWTLVGRWRKVPG